MASVARATSNRPVTPMHLPEQQTVLTTTTIGGTLISFFASTLPILQWIAAAVAITTGVTMLVKTLRKK